MPRLKRLSGGEIIAVFERFGFQRIKRRGSHVKLRRTGSAGEKQTLTIPDHKSLDTGTTRAILRQAVRYIAAEELNPFLYGE